MRLPEFLVDPFEARKIDDSSIVYFDDQVSDLNEESLRETYAYMGPDGRDCPSSPAQRRTFYAERYGGAGIGSNGGGARCGTDGRYLVKGMGSNQLQGVGSPFWYGHGTLPLVDALAEAIWAKMLKHALPFGAVATPAVIATGRTSWTRERGGVRKEHPGALLIREATLRLASFERAIFFNPETRSDGEFVNKPALADVQRTRSAANFLPSALLAGELADGASPSARSADAADAILEGLRNLGQKIAMQSAAASAKRIMHGALTGSNIALDSRWMDLGCVTGLSGFGLPPSFRPSMWREYTKLKDSFCNIMYYCWRYNPACKRLDFRRASLEICAHIDKWYEYYLSSCLLNRFGFPSDFTENLRDKTEFAALAKCLLSIAQSGTAVDHDRFYEHGERIGSYDFYAICALLSSGGGAERIGNVLGHKLKSRANADHLLETYRSCLSSLRYSLGDAESGVSVEGLINVNCIKSSFVDGMSPRTALNDELEKEIDQKGISDDLRCSVRNMTSRMERFALESLAEHRGLTAFCGVVDGADITYSARSNAFEVHSAHGTTVVSRRDIYHNDGCPISRHLIRRISVPE